MEHGVCTADIGFIVFNGVHHRSKIRRMEMMERANMFLLERAPDAIQVAALERPCPLGILDNADTEH